MLLQCWILSARRWNDERNYRHEVAWTGRCYNRGWKEYRQGYGEIIRGEGAKIAVIEMHEGRGQAVVAEITKAGQEAMLVVCDVAKSSDVEAMVSKVVARFGGIDILVNNAALTDHANIFESTEEEFDKVIAVSLKGPYLVTKHVAAQMAKQDRGGKILNFGSTSGLIGRADGIAYAAAKAGVINMTRAMAVQLSPYKIRVNCVVPNRSGSPVGFDDDVTGSRTFENLAGDWEPQRIRPKQRFFWSATIPILSMGTP